MCGIVGAVAQRDVQGILLEGLKRLEYRGYDSAGLAVLDDRGVIQRQREVGKVAALEEAITDNPPKGHMGIAHTRWATHGKPSAENAHPHMSGDRLAVVHNGIIENFETLRSELQGEGFEFDSETDTEVVAHLIEREYRRAANLTEAFHRAVALVHGAYALAVMHADEPESLLVARQGSPWSLVSALASTSLLRTSLPCFRSRIALSTWPRGYGPGSQRFVADHRPGWPGC